MPNSFHTEGVDAFKNNDYAQAKILLLQAIAANPEEAESYLYLGKAYFLADEKNAAIAPLIKYIKLNQHNAAEVANVSCAFDLLGQCYEAGNKDLAALRAYKIAIKVDRSCAAAWHNMGLLYIKSAQHYLEQDLRNSSKLFYGAIIFLIKALALSRTNPQFLHSIASWHEKYVEVLQEMVGAPEAVQQHIKFNFNLALKYYQQALVACHADDVGLKNIIRSNLTECFAQYGHYLYGIKEYASAQQFYGQALRIDPAHLAAINQMGMSLFHQQRFMEARTYFADLLDKTAVQQGQADAWLNIACTHRLEKAWVEAKSALAKAKELAPEDDFILAEEKQLAASQLAAQLISTPQRMFHPASAVVPKAENTALLESIIKP